MRAFNSFAVWIVRGIACILVGPSAVLAGTWTVEIPEGKDAIPVKFVQPASAGGDPRVAEFLPITELQDYLFEERSLAHLFPEKGPVDPAIRRQFEGSGLAYGFAASLLHVSSNAGEKAASKCKGTVWPKEHHLKLNWNKMSFTIDEPNRSAVFDITTNKTLTTLDGQPICVVEFHWIIAVKAGGLRFGEITHPTKRPDLKYKYYARGADIEVVAFSVNGKSLEYFSRKTGALSPLARIYSPSPDDCIDINSRVRLNGHGVLKKADLTFCAGSCSGFLWATGD